MVGLTKFQNFVAAIEQLASIAQTHGDANDVVTIRQTATLVDDFMRNHNLVANPTALSLESFTRSTTISMNSGACDIDRIGCNAFLNLAQRVAPRADAHTAKALAAEFARIINDGEQRPAAHFEAGRGPSGEGTMNISQVVGDRALGGVVGDAAGALEAFGVNMDTIASDPRLNLTVVALRTHRSIADRVLPRFVQEQNTVTISKPIPEVYDLTASRSADPQVRNFGTHKQPVISLYTNPSIISTEPKRIVPLLANDTNGTMLLADGVLRVGERVPLFDMALTNQVGNNAIDYTDLVSEGGVVESLRIEVRQPGSPDVVSVFTVPVDYASSARFTMTSNTQDSRDRNANVRAYWIAKKGDKDDSGVANAVLSAFTDANVEVDITFNSSINLQSGFVTGGGTLAPKLTKSSDAPISSGTETEYSTLRFTIIGYTVRTWYNEENMRKTVTALRTGRAQQQFEIPVGRSILVDFSMQQDEPTDVLELVSTATSIGNSTRALSIITSKMDVVKRQLDFEDANPGYPYMYKAANDFAAGSKCNPTIIDDILDFDAVGNELAVLRESERMTEVHSRMRHSLIAIIAAVSQKSLYDRNLAENEVKVFKMVTSTYLKTVLLGVMDYHNVFNDRATDKGSTAEKADLSFYLPDGTRIDVVTTEFAEFADTMLFWPVREADPGDVTSFAGVHDRGTFTCQFTPQNPGGSVNRRIVTNSREIVFVTNPVAGRLKVRNLGKHIKHFSTIGSLT